jgi:hypothetical protein
MRHEARSKQIKLHDLAADIVATVGTPVDQLES